MQIIKQTIEKIVYAPIALTDMVVHAAEPGGVTWWAINHRYSPTRFIYGKYESFWLKVYRYANNMPLATPTNTENHD